MNMETKNIIITILAALVIILGAVVIAQAQPKPRIVHLDEGWNLVAMPEGITATPPNEVFNNSEIVDVWGWDSVNSTSTYYSPDNESPYNGHYEPISLIEPSVCYWINADSSVNLTFDHR